MVKKNNLRPWINRHINDEFVKKSKKDNYRSRAVYKLIEMVTRYKFIKIGSKVLDLGAAPGSWSQFVIKTVGNSGKVIASDILSIKKIEDVHFIHGDFTETLVYASILKLAEHNKIDVVLSDMAPNISGQLSVDMPRSMRLCELALDIAVRVLTPQGYFFVKVFQGYGFDDFIMLCKDAFNKVIIKKPKASRASSKEVYLLASGLKLNSKS